MKISTLVNAAKISPFIQHRTIGPDHQTNGNKENSIKERQENSDQSEVDSVNTSNNNQSKSSNEPITPTFRKNVWREVNIDSEISLSPRNILNLSDCKLVSFRLAAKDAEKKRRSKILSNLQVKQDQWEIELEQRLQQIRINSAEEHQQKQAKRLERERLALRAIEDIEAQAKQDELNSVIKKNEMIEHSRKLIEKANQLKKQNEMRLLIEHLNAHKALFINLFELFAKTIVNYQTVLSQQDKLNEYIQKRDELLQRYEKIINLVNARPVSDAETGMFENLCDDIKKEQNDLNAEIETILKQLEAKPKPIEAPINVQPMGQPIVPVPVAQDVSVTDGNPLAISTVKTVGSEDRIAYYFELMKFYEEYRMELQPLLNDVNTKKFRFNCQKSLNTPVNSIAAVSAMHLQDKFEKISHLLAGNHVSIGDFHFNASEHPLGIKYCTFLLAKKFIVRNIPFRGSHLFVIGFFC